MILLHVYLIMVSQICRTKPYRILLLTFKIVSLVGTNTFQTKQQAQSMSMLLHNDNTRNADSRAILGMQVTPAQPECILDDPWTSSNPDSYMRQLCAPGYYGPVCSLCVTSGNVTYGRVGALQCKPCRRTVSVISAYIASALLVLAWLSYTVHMTLVENEEAAAGLDDPQRTSQLIRVSS